MSHTPLELMPYTVSASVSFLRRAANVFFVLPTVKQADLWIDKIVTGDEKLRKIDAIKEYAALSLIGHNKVTVVAAT